MFQKEDNALYRCWRERSDDDTKHIMAQMKEEETADCFGEIPSFGTGGIRKAEGIGPNRINAVTIGWAAAALAITLKETYDADTLKKGVMIGFDTRKNSRAYAEKTALTLNGYNIPAIIFEDPIPVPLLSFVLKRDHYPCGVMITASHNPEKYNGFKVYNQTGGQLVPAEAEAIQARFYRINPFEINRLSKTEAKEKGLLYYTGKAEESAYLSAITGNRFTDSALNIVATPLHGAAYKLLPAALKRCGHTVTTVAAQEQADGTFPTVTAPNPEDPAVFRLAQEEGCRRQADLLIATDGDGDRCGCCVKQGNGYQPLSGNEIAAILLCYLLEREKNRLPRNSYTVRTAVSGSLGETIAAAYGLKTLTTPTGFKYIGEKLSNTENGIFFAGYEESGGFLYGNHAADKDGIATAVLLAEAAAVCKKQGKNLLDVLGEIHAQYGREYTQTRRFAFPGRDGATRKEACLRWFKEHPQTDVTTEIRDNTLFFCLGNGIKTALRPSGTEPELKLYRMIQASDEREAAEKNRVIDSFFLPIIHSFLPQSDYSAKSGVER